MERVIRADSSTVELSRGRDNLGACGSIDGTKGSSTRQSEEIERTSSKMRRVEGGSFRVRVLEGHSPVQSG